MIAIYYNPHIEYIFPTYDNYKYILVLFSLLCHKYYKCVYIQDDDLRRIIDESRAIENQHGHYLDYVLVLGDGDMDSASRELLDVINRLEVEPQWVPMAWLRARSTFPAAAQQPSMNIYATPAPHVAPASVPIQQSKQVQYANPNAVQTAAFKVTDSAL